MKIGKTQSAYICKNCDGQCEGCIFEAEKEPELTYQQKELMIAAEKHDWTYGMSLKLSGSENSGKTISVSETQFKKLLKIFR